MLCCGGAELLTATGQPQRCNETDKENVDEEAGCMLTFGDTFRQSYR
jgi:hypothetical protein